jgi:hypothetical protein
MIEQITRYPDEKVRHNFQVKLLTIHRYPDSLPEVSKRTHTGLSEGRSLETIAARVAEQVDARDLKSLGT